MTELTKEEQLLRDIFGDKGEPLDCKEHGCCVHFPDGDETFTPVCCRCGKTYED